MNELIAHRGSRRPGTWAHERGHVGPRPTAGSASSTSSPATSRCPTRRGRWITYNGEVYNYPELVQELGAASRRSGDTEVVLRAHDQWGADALDRLLRGMFAYALWDEQSQELLCARDRFGIKPFYYAVVDDVFYFASEAEGAAADASRGRDRPRRAQGLPRLPVLPRRQDALQGHPRAPARPLPPAAARRRRAAALLGGLLRDRLGPRRRLLRGADRRAARRVGGAAPALRRPGLGLPLGRRRLQRGAGLARGSASRAACSPSPASSPRTPATTKVAVRADRRRAAGPRAARDRHRRRGLHRARSRTSPTTWTTRRRAPGRSRSTWSPRPRPSRSR